MKIMLDQCVRRDFRNARVYKGMFPGIPLIILLATLMTASAASPAGIESSLSVRDVPPALMQAAECMASIARAVPGVTDVQITVSTGSGGAYPVLEFRSLDTFGRRRFTEVSLFEISGANDAYVFDKADIEGDPVANRLLPEWKRRCQAGVGVITSEPGL